MLPSSAAKYSAPPRIAKPDGLELLLPGRMSMPIVPSSVPSLVHSSEPVLPSLALKKRVPPTSISWLGLEPKLPGRMSRTWTVPAVVPSVL